MSSSAPLRGRRRLHLTLPEELLAAVETRRELAGKTRSEFIEEAVRLKLEELDQKGLERRNGLGSRLRDIEETVLSLRELVGEYGLRNLYASERTYAIFEFQFGDRLAASRRDTHEVARKRLDPGDSKGKTGSEHREDSAVSRRDGFDGRGGV